jgi:hypothetical protein
MATVMLGRISERLATTNPDPPYVLSTIAGFLERF